MKHVEYVHLLPPTDKVRVRFKKDWGRVLSFAVQYYALVKGQWRSIIRVDTVHGFAHKDIYHYLHGKKYTILLSENLRDYNNLLNESVRDIKQNFERIKRNYLSP